MVIRTRFSISADGYATTPDGWPSLVADPAFVSGQSHGWPEFQASCEAALMGRHTFEPALSSDRWPWPDLDVSCSGATCRPKGHRCRFVTHSDPERLLEKVRAANKGRDVHVVGGLQTIETLRRIGGLDKLGLLIMPIFLGGGRRLTETVSLDTKLTLEEARPLPEGAIDVVYGVA
ncbi:MAG: dihydrofolate reductase family protein [Solirubrobacteraceae bacterium]